MLASDVINQALRIMGVIASGETASGDDSTTGLEYLRDLFAEWRGSGVMIPDYTVSALSTTLSIDNADKQAVAYQLALRMSDEYGWEPSPKTMANINESFNRLQMRYFVITPSVYDDLPSVPWDPDPLNA
jgi:hypothetical protein